MHQTSARKKNRRTISALQTTRAIVTQRFRSPVRRQAGRARTEPAPVTAPLIALHLSVILHTGHTHPRHRFLKPPGYTTNCKHEGFPSFPCLPTSSKRLRAVYPPPCARPGSPPGLDLFLGLDASPFKKTDGIGRKRLYRAIFSIISRACATDASLSSPDSMRATSRTRSSPSIARSSVVGTPSSPSVFFTT